MRSTPDADSRPASSLRLCYVGWGDHVHLERWAAYFARTGHAVSVLSTSGAGRYPTGVRQHRIGFETRDERFRHVRMRWLLWRLRPQLVHAHWAHFAYDVTRAWKKPFVVTAWGSDIYRLDEFSASLLQRLKVALTAAHAITCDSQDLARAIAERVPEAAARIHVIQWGIDTAHFRSTGRDNAFARSLGISGRPVVFSPRNFTPIYNQETIVRAFRRVVDARPDTVLLFKNYGGDEDYKHRVLALVRELHLEASVRVVETIPYEQMADLYSLAHVCVSVPFSDATPASLLEAMACGCVPVCSNLPSLREWITDGVNGFLVPVEDPAALAAKILSALDSATAAFVPINRRIVEERASQRAHMSRMLAIYEDILTRADAKARIG